eukprot:3228160-Rhodomonas_salina.3
MRKVERNLKQRTAPLCSAAKSIACDVSTRHGDATLEDRRRTYLLAEGLHVPIEAADAREREEPGGVRAAVRPRHRTTTANDAERGYPLSFCSLSTRGIRAKLEPALPLSVHTDQDARG